MVEFCPAYTTKPYLNDVLKIVSVALRTQSWVMLTLVFPRLMARMLPVLPAGVQEAEISRCSNKIGGGGGDGVTKYSQEYTTTPETTIGTIKTKTKPRRDIPFLESVNNLSRESLSRIYAYS